MKASMRARALKRVVAPIVAMLWCYAGSAAAQLGGNAESIEADRTALNLQTSLILTNTSYKVYQLGRPGLTVWEFLDNTGTVFAVGWQGVGHPDLSSLLGPYLAEFSGALQTSGRNHGHRGSQVAGRNLVVETWKALNVARGLAYLRPALPAGVTGTELGSQIR